MYARSSITMISIIVSCIIIDLAEIITFATSKLQPLTYVLSQVVKTTTWVVLFTLSVVDPSKLQISQELSRTGLLRLGNTLPVVSLRV